MWFSTFLFVCFKANKNERNSPSALGNTPLPTEVYISLCPPLSSHEGALQPYSDGWDENDANVKTKVFK